MDTILFLNLGIGLLITHRTVHLLKITNIIAVEHEKKLRWLYFVSPIMLLLLNSIGHTKLFWLFNLIYFMVPFLAAELVERYRAHQFVNETRDFYDELVFEVRSGNSLRSSLDRIIGGPQFGFYTREMVGVALKNADRVVLSTWFSRSKHERMTNQRVVELRRLLQFSGKILERLQFLRKIHQLEQKFRRKSRVATRQVRAQALIVVILYAGLLILQISTGFTRWNSPFVSLSAALLLLGLFVFFCLMRSFRWKV